MRNDARHNRKQILAAAESVFGEHGATGSTEEVARRAGVGIATVFRHFPTKSALLEATLLAHFAELRRQANESADTGDPFEAVCALVRVMVETGATKLALATLLDADGGIPASALTASEELRAVVDTVLSRARAAGVVRASVSVDEIYLLIRALAQASASQPTDTVTMSRAIDIILAGIQPT
ncbi:TetR/AcrR family transcriptional regulator [Nocardia australiensis]|uniref:TetR/AcrR family transcriptional regulator n=1 Tax=Nocardia australiensis TaxID=2887191 RepID=UPI001D159512|nr:TetR/AcrR family transcriptional regulator [Nocardia australiensis]